MTGLIEALSQVDGRGHTALAHVSRLIRAEGMIQKTRRGPAAVKITNSDAAALILGANAYIEAKDAGLATVAYWPLPRRPELDRHDAPPPPAFAAILAAPTLGEALVRLIEAAPEVARADNLDSDRAGHRTYGEPVPVTALLDRSIADPAVVTLYIPEAAARLEMSLRSPGTTKLTRWTAVFGEERPLPPAFDYHSASYLIDGAHTDRKVTFSVGFATFEIAHYVVAYGDR